MCGTPSGGKLPKWKENALRYGIKIPARIHLLCSGVVSCGWSFKKEVDYKKWLGPDWKPTFEGAGIQVSNHQSWIDIMALLYLQCPSFVSSE